MQVQIKHRFTGAVLFEAEVDASLSTEGLRLGAAVKLALKARANLAGADLAGADLAGAYLAGAYLAGAYLAGADLARAYLAGAYLAGADLARANLAGADLAGAYLAGANLAGADLARADLARANFDIPPATPEQAIANLDKVREIILDDSKRLEMGHWHEDKSWEGRTCAEEAVCGTSHCLAGWLQVCATDPKIRELAPNIAGTICAPVAAKMFYADNETTLEWLRERKYAAEA